MTWRGSRPPLVRQGRPYVLKRLGRWCVLTYDHGILAAYGMPGPAHDLALAWAVYEHGMAGAVERS